MDTTIQTVEEYLDHLIKAAEFGAANVPKLDKRDKASYNDALDKIRYWDFIQSADYHYFISRVLFLHYIETYSKFCGYQCIENYFKAFLKYKNQIPPKEHPLPKLLQLCRKADTDNNSFLQSDYISIITSMFDPFYEYARYPVHNVFPKTGYATFFPDDIYILDYFVMKMRTILSIPAGHLDILVDGHFNLHQCQKSYPDFYNVFFVNNINFSNQ